MIVRVRSFGRAAALAVIAAIAFNLTQRLMDHFIDGMVDQTVWLAWLK